ncbi:hypothetical protein AZI86_10700 [Bdellovibrio bacteriovorus]|uniref:Uncharacterized protein n=1 Tax=Bdellovibrio bacteriovorus TaxID=959 RepID=A0A150WLA3_BDEBC|nr:hypothetical protein [Bdellovibrio bacteriovorus]KYG64672.1 hypothetical protein AZI86_10700 [Bdellovibrio bacteriovorus]
MKITKLDILLTTLLVFESSALAVLHSNQKYFFAGSAESQDLALVTEATNGDLRPFDSLNFFPVESGQTVRNGDLLRTREAPMIIEVLGDNTEVIINPYSLVRVTLHNQKIQIDLRHGKYTFKAPALTSAPIEESKNKDQKPEEINSEVQDKVPDKGKQFYPAPGSVLLYLPGATLKVILEARCIGECRVSMSFNNEPYLKPFIYRPMEPIQISLNGLTGQFHWTLQADDGNYKGDFEVLPFNKDTMKQMLDAGKNVEVVY